MKKRVKIFLGILVVVAALSGVIYNYYKGTEVEVYKVKKRLYSQSFKEVGQVVPSKETSISSTRDGKIISLKVQEGQNIKSGDLILRLENKEIDYKIKDLEFQLKGIYAQKLQSNSKSNGAQVEGYKLQIENLKSQLEAAKSDLGRVTILYKDGIVSKVDYEKAEQNVKNIESMILQQENNIKIVQKENSPVNGTNEYYSAMQESISTQIQALEYEKSKGDLYSPVNGTVKAVNIKEGAFAASGTPVVELFSDGDYMIETYVSTKDINGIKLNMNVECILETNKKDLVFKGVVKKIAPAAVSKVSTLGLEEQRVKVTIKPELKNIPVRAGYDLDVKFTTLQRENSIFITKSAVFPYNDGKAVWVINGSKAHIQPVKTGLEDNKDIIIESGLKEGDLVILDHSIKGKGTRYHPINIE
ncbi:HlyD family secretion protein [Clostridium pascui]|uniref:efflux RND transporter periplasmic adaptor subunit n=1 Tax=Clostridium pascui TaxID=46609 RepID=UPI001957843F|nr:HlyD family efflux transporter periplasmic adaptor subunit [Clostridium pascui]MBM7869546.1 HlyD family secretion protein [Clostridium pascui]